MPREWLVVTIACVAGLVWERLHWWRDKVLARHAACPGHRWLYISLYDELRLWNRKCELCRYQEIAYEGPHLGDKVKIGKETVIWK